MLGLAVIFGLSCLCCLGLTPVIRSLAVRFRFLDHPDQERKNHGRPMPLGGGLAVLLSVTFGLAAAWAGGLVPPGNRVGDSGPGPFGLLLASLVIVLVGIIDDWERLRGRLKLLGQLLAIGILLCSGLAVRELGVCGCRIPLGWFSLPFTVFWMLGAINSCNLLDGLDGLLSSAGLLMSLALAALALSAGHGGTACVALALGGALLGFLRHNFPPATIFLGDGGSMFVGLLVGYIGIRCSLAAPGTFFLAAPVAILIVPILDTGAAVLRRIRAGKSICEGDRRHLHHCLLLRGYSPRQVLLCIAGLCLVPAVAALLSARARNDCLAILAALGITGLVIGGGLFVSPDGSERRARATALSLLQPGKTGPGEATAARTEKCQVEC